MQKKSFSLSNLILATTVVCLALGFFFQYREASRLRARFEQEKLREVIRDQRMQEIYGLFLHQRGGEYHIPSGEHVFDGGLRVVAGDRWCRFRFHDDYDPTELRELLDFVTPKVFLLMTRGEVEGVLAAWEAMRDARQQPTDVTTRQYFESGIRALLTIEKLGVSPRYAIYFDIDDGSERWNGAGPRQ